MSKQITTSESLDAYNRISLEIEETYGAAARHLGISDTELLILYILLYNTQVTQAEMTRLCGLPKQTINSALKKMEQSALLTLSLSSGRKKEIHLTEKGESLAENTAGRVIAAEQAAFAEMKEEDRADLLRLGAQYGSLLRKEMEKI